MSYTTYKNSKYEIIKNKKGHAYVKDGDTQKIYYKDSISLESIKFDSITDLKWSYKDSVLAFLIALSIICFFYLSHYRLCCKVRKIKVNLPLLTYFCLCSH
jgi:hypothetical protein